MFIACGINHETADISLREAVAVSPYTHNALMQRLLDNPQISEVMVLSTCNRTEIYCESSQDVCIISWFAAAYNIEITRLTPAFYMYVEEQAVKHVLRVASGLDSMMLGEPQILGQIKQAYRKACEEKTIKHNLRSIFQYIFSASKRIRTKSGIGKHPISVAFAAVQLINKAFPPATSLTILIIGSGETASLVGRYLYEQNLHKFLIASRTDINAEGLAHNIGGSAIPIHEINLYLKDADVVISATACPLPFISATMVKKALSERDHATMLFLDLAIPRDIEADVATLPAVTLYNIDDLHHKTLDGLHERYLAASLAEELLAQEMEEFAAWQRARVAKQLICEYRNSMRELAEQEATRSLQLLAKGQCQSQVINELTDRLVNKLMHTTTIGLRQVAVDKRHELLELAHYLFTRNIARHETIS